MPYQLTEDIKADIREHGDLHVTRIHELAAKHHVPFYQMRDWCASLLSKPKTTAINERSMRRAQQFLADVPSPNAAQLAIIKTVADEEAKAALGHAPRACADPECGKVFTPLVHAEQRYCSPECVRRSLRVSRTPRSCANPSCGEVFIPPNSNPKKRFCSHRCSGIAQRGPRTPLQVEWNDDEAASI